MHEIERLEGLLPPELRSRVSIERSNAPALITTKKVSKRQFVVQIDWVRWHQFSSSQCDLLFWHEVSRIQNRSVTQFSWEIVIASIGLSTAFAEFLSQNVLSLSIALVITGLAGYYFYQRKQGEEGLRDITLADRGAIDLATQFGYSPMEAHSSLYSALEKLSKQHSPRWSSYQVRLRVLEILAASSRQFTPESFLKLNAAPSHEFEV